MIQTNMDGNCWCCFTDAQFQSENLESEVHMHARAAEASFFARIGFCGCVK